jgi:hypothetical protein
MSVEPENDLGQVLAGKVPLVGQLKFSQGQTDEAEELPPVVALFSLMADPTLPGDTCVLLPRRENIAALTSIISALQATSEKFPELREKYLKNSFEVGQRVRVLPTGHVYLFDGYFEDYGCKFFKLRVMDDPTRATRAFPMKDAIRLEKTNRFRPKGKGETDLGQFHKSKFDFIAGTETGGNNALMENEVILVTTRSAFEEFIGNIQVARSDNPGDSFPLSEVIPWGTVNHEGEIEFRNSAAATGKPMIAVSPRAEYVAAFCRLNGEHTPRVIVDGASRIKDMQALDDIVDFGKLLLFADHSEAENLAEISRHDCRVWKMTDDQGTLVNNGTLLLKSFNDAFSRARDFSIDVITCGSTGIDQVSEDIFEAERMLRENESDDHVMQFISIAFARLLDISALIHDPGQEEFIDLKKRLQDTYSSLSAQRTWIPSKAYDCVTSVFDRLGKLLSPDPSEARTAKQLALLELVGRLQSENVDLTVIGSSTLAADSATRFLQAESVKGVRVMALAEYLITPKGEEIILTGWPRARNLAKLINGYTASKIYALGFNFEVSWFKGAVKRRKNNISRWQGDMETFSAATGLPPEYAPYKDGTAGRVVDEPAIQVIDFEKRLSTIRKGSRSIEFEPHEARDARYVGFIGQTYSYLTESHSIPKITGLVRGEYQEQTKVPIETIDGLEVGDFILFRVQADSDRDIIRFIAEQITLSGEYEKIRQKAESWKVFLRSIADTPSDISRKLHDVGLRRSNQAIRLWLTDENMIGPGDEEALEMIAQATGNEDFQRKIPEVWEAIQSIRGSHTSAGFKLSELLVNQLPQQMSGLSVEETVLELALGDIRLGKVAIVQIEVISDELEPRPYWEVNRLHWDQN